MVKGLVCDQGTNNVSALKALGVTSQQPFLLYEGEKYHVFYDVPHLLKSLRNNLLTGDFTIDGKKFV